MSFNKEKLINAVIQEEVTLFAEQKKESLQKTPNESKLAEISALLRACDWFLNAIKESEEDEDKKVDVDSEEDKVLSEETSSESEK